MLDLLLQAGEPRFQVTVDGRLGAVALELAVPAEAGYEGMTIDMVAARAGAARATVYRRWATKADLVLAAAARMSQADAGLDHLPDTGSFRGDVIALFVPDTPGDQQVRL